MDFTSYQSHSLDSEKIYTFINDLKQDHNRFVRTNTFVQGIVQQYQEEQREWDIYFDDISGTHRINGPAGISLIFSEKVCHFHHWIRWRTFLLNKEIQTQLRGICFELKEYLNSQFVIYVPDNAAIESAIMDFLWDDEDRDINYIKEWLEKNCGSPRNKISNIYVKTENSWESKGYYIDLFKDFVR